MRVRCLTLTHTAKPRRVGMALPVVASAALSCGVLAEPVRQVETMEDTPVEVPCRTCSPARVPTASLAIKSSNPILVPESNVCITRTASGPTLTITPAPNQAGSATLEVNPGDAMSAETFTFTVHPLNDAPTISPIPDQVVSESGSTAPVAFTIGDIETPGASLIVTAVSSDASLLPNSGLVLGGSGASRTVVIRPTAGKSGTASVTITVSDGEASTSRTFQARIGTVNQPPLANAGEDQTIWGTNVAVLNGTATDDGLPRGTERLSSRWSVSEGSASVRFANAEALNSTVEFGASGVYRLILTASDGELTSSDEVVVVVREAPALTEAGGRNRR